MSNDPNKRLYDLVGMKPPEIASVIERDGGHVLVVKDGTAMHVDAAGEVTLYRGTPGRLPLHPKHPLARAAEDEMPDAAAALIAELEAEDADDEPADAGPEAPSDRAGRAKWAEYALALGADAEVVEGMSKADLIVATADGVFVDVREVDGGDLDAGDGAEQD